MEADQTVAAQRGSMTLDLGSCREEISNEFFLING
jgi:hypothetical protein